MHHMIDRWVVLVASDEVANAGGVGRARLVVHRVRRERRLWLLAEETRDHVDVQADRSRLVDHHDAVPIGVVEPLLGVGVVRGAEGIGADPAHQLEVVHEERIIVSLAPDGRVLVLAEACQVERFTIDQELLAADLHGSDADRKRVGVSLLAELDREVVQICRSGLPQVRVRNRERSRCSHSPDHHGAGLVAQGDADLGSRPGDLDLVRHHGAVVRGGRADRDVGDVLGRCRVEADAAGQARVIEEVVPVSLTLPAQLIDRQHPRRDGGARQPVVDRDRHAGGRTGLNVIRHVSLERRVSALVLGDEHIVDIDRARVRRRVHAEHDALIPPHVRDHDVALIPDHPDMPADSRVDEDVVVAGRDGRLTGDGQRGLPRPVADLVVESECPQTIQ